MFKRLLKKTLNYMAKATRRFMANQPASPYETIVFGAIRSVATQFGRFA